MSYSLFYFEEARLDVIAAKAWYEEQKDRLGRQFAKSIKTAILRIQSNPLAYGVRYKNVRIAHPKTFPYGIHFYIDESTSQIVIIAIVHNKRHPDVARKRI